MHRYQNFNTGSRKRARRESSENQNITPIVIENYKKNPELVFNQPLHPPTNTKTQTTSKTPKTGPHEKQQYPHLPQGHPFPKLSALTMARRPIQQSTIHLQTDTKTRLHPPHLTPQQNYMVIRGIHTNIAEEQVKQELEKQRINILRIHRIISKATQQPTTFIKIHLTNPDQSASLLHKGFYMDLFQYRVEKARPPSTIKQCFKCQRFNHISTHCTNPVSSDVEKITTTNHVQNTKEKPNVSTVLAITLLPPDPASSTSHT
ncbi:hypothetical protein ABVT39_026585 [Epinephelus coioides]